MSTLEREIIEKFNQLDEDAKKRVRRLIEQETGSEGQAAASGFDCDQWFHDVEALRKDIVRKHEGTLPPMDVVDLLREIRDGEDE